MPELTDEEIAAAVQKGDIESFGVLVERYEARIRRYAKKFLLDGGDADDVVQEVFVKAFTNIRSFDIRRRFSPWLYRIAHNEFINAIHRRSAWKMVSIFDPDAVLPPLFSGETADADATRNELRQALDAYLDKLDAKYRELLVLYYYEEMGYGEIAEVLQIPTGTVGVRLRRGRAALKRLMERGPQIA